MGSSDRETSSAPLPSAPSQLPLQPRLASAATTNRPKSRARRFGVGIGSSFFPARGFARAARHPRHAAPVVPAGDWLTSAVFLRESLATDSESGRYLRHAGATRVTRRTKRQASRSRRSLPAAPLRTE